jgi:hypothetical protein
MLNYIFGEAFMQNLSLALKYAYPFFPFIILAIVVKLLFDNWVYYKRQAYWQSLGQVLLEIKLPKEVSKSPAAMEIFLTTLHQVADESGWYFKYWKGQTRGWFSLEIVSLGGEVHFYIWTRLKYRSNIEAQLYAQYPGVEVHEVPDYTLPYAYDPEKYKLYGTQWILGKPDAYPIKTYVDYGLDRDPKEEFKIDPIVSMLEFLGSVQKGHMIWIQIIVRAHKDEQRKPGTWFETTDAWKDSADAEIKKIVEKFRPEDKEKQSRQATEGEKDMIAALERSVSKFPFDTTIRSIYMAEKDIYNPMYLGGMLGIFKQFSSVNLNSFKSSGWSGVFDRPWKSEFPFKLWYGDKEQLNKALVEEYKLRRFFFSPHGGKHYYSKPIVLNTEELATLFHFPGLVSTTPTLERVPSKKSEAPANLPV